MGSHHFQHSGEIYGDMDGERKALDEKRQLFGPTHAPLVKDSFFGHFASGGIWTQQRQPFHQREKNTQKITESLGCLEPLGCSGRVVFFGPSTTTRHGRGARLPEGPAVLEHP